MGGLVGRWVGLLTDCRLRGWDGGSSFVLEAVDIQFSYISTFVDIIFIFFSSQLRL